MPDELKTFTGDKETGLERGLTGDTCTPLGDGGNDGVDEIDEIVGDRSWHDEGIPGGVIKVGNGGAGAGGRQEIGPLVHITIANLGPKL